MLVERSDVSFAICTSYVRWGKAQRHVRACCLTRGFLPKAPSHLFKVLICYADWIEGTDFYAAVTFSALPLKKQKTKKPNNNTKNNNKVVVEIITSDPSSEASVPTARE